MNPWLGNEVYALGGGGKLIPVDGDDAISGNFQAVVNALPEPEEAMLVLGLAAASRRRRAK